VREGTANKLFYIAHGKQNFCPAASRNFGNW
jgi:hypothetical protein